MTFLDKVKDNVIEFLRPGARQESGELRAMRQMYDNANAGNLRPNCWYRIVNTASGAVCGFGFVCNCAHEYTLLQPHEWMRDYECSLCRAKFNLYKNTGIIDPTGNFKVNAAEIENLLSKLPVRPRLTGANKPSFVDTWSEGGDGEVGYEPFTPSGLMGR